MTGVSSAPTASSTPDQPTYAIHRDGRLLGWVRQIQPRNETRWSAQRVGGHWVTDEPVSTERLALDALLAASL